MSVTPNKIMADTEFDKLVGALNHFKLQAGRGQIKVDGTTREVRTLKDLETQISYFKGAATDSARMGKLDQAAQKARDQFKTAQTTAAVAITPLAQNGKTAQLSGTNPSHMPDPRFPAPYMKPTVTVKDPAAGKGVPPTSSSSSSSSLMSSKDGTRVSSAQPGSTAITINPPIPLPTSSAEPAASLDGSADTAAGNTAEERTLRSLDEIEDEARGEIQAGIRTTGKAVLSLGKLGLTKAKDVVVAPFKSVYNHTAKVSSTLFGASVAYFTGAELVKHFSQTKACQTTIGRKLEGFKYENARGIFGKLFYDPKSLVDVVNPINGEIVQTPNKGFTKVTANVVDVPLPPSKLCQAVNKAAEKIPTLSDAIGYVKAGSQKVADAVAPRLTSLRDTLSPYATTVATFASNHKGTIGLGVGALVVAYTAKKAYDNRDKISAGIKKCLEFIVPRKFGQVGA